MSTSRRWFIAGFLLLDWHIGVESLQVVHLILKLHVVQV